MLKVSLWFQRGLTGYRRLPENSNFDKLFLPTYRPAHFQLERLAMASQPLVLLSQPASDTVIQIVIELRSQLSLIKPPVILNPAPKNRIHNPGDLLNREVDQGRQSYRSDSGSHTQQRLRTHRWQEIREENSS